MKTIFKLLKQLRTYYPNLSNIDLVIAGLEELLNQNRMVVRGHFIEHKRINYLAEYNSEINEWRD